jgi:WD40 repeat protein
MRLNNHLALLLVITTAHAFVTRHPSASTSTAFVTRRASSVFDDFEEFASSESNSNDSDLYAALRNRQAALESPAAPSLSEESSSSSFREEQEDSSLTDWKQATCSSTVRLTLDDWIRRLAIDTYPLCVAGSAKGNLYLADLQRGEELDSLGDVHAAQAQEDISPDHIEEALSKLYGKFDGGGVIALDGIKDDLIVLAGREGGVHVCGISGQEEDVYTGSRGGTSKQTKLRLKRLGKIRGLDAEENVLITSLVFDDAGILWMGGYDGILRGYDTEEQDVDERPLMMRQKSPQHKIQVGSPIVNLSVNNDIGCGVAATVSKGIVLFSLDDGEIIGRWNPLVKKVRKEFVRSAIIVQNDSGKTDDNSWSVICGGSRGSMFQRQLNVDQTGFVSDTRPFLDQQAMDETAFPIKMRPNHLGPVVALVSPAPGLLVSGALDGSMRVWDCSPSSDNDEEDEEEAQYDDVQAKDSRPQCLYALSGYKVWLGSMFANRNKLVSDGADNTIIVHSFTFEDEEDALFREDEDDDMEGFSFE